jgi:hypothetical protein
MIGQMGIGHGFEKNNLRKSALRSAKICGKGFSPLNNFRVEESFPADKRR